MTVERTSKEIIIKLPLSVNIEEIQRFLNYLRYKELSSKSQASQEDADTLSKVVDQGWWEKNKDRFLPEE